MKWFRRHPAAAPARRHVAPDPPRNEPCCRLGTQKGLSVGIESDRVCLAANLNETVCIHMDGSTAVKVAESLLKFGHQLSEDTK